MTPASALCGPLHRPLRQAMFRPRNILTPVGRITALRALGLRGFNINHASFGAAYVVAPVVEQEVQHGKT